MSTPFLFSPDDFGDDVHDDDISYVPLDDVAWVDDEDANAIEVTEDEIAAPAEAVEVTEVVEAVEGAAPASAPDAAPASATPPQPETRAAGPDAPAAPCLFRVVMALDGALRDAIEAARGDLALEGAAPAALELIAPFRSDDPAALAEALHAWAAERLPFALTLREVTAEVIDARRYVAGWALDPAGRITVAQQALARALSDLIDPCDEAPDAFEPRIVVADRVPASVFPRLIADMQQVFAPQDWTVTAIVLEAASPDARSPRWTPHLTLP